MLGQGSGFAGGYEDHHFSITAARFLLYDKLPKEVKRQLAYRHFYTDDLNSGIAPESQITSSLLSAQFFGSLLMYLIALFKLEGRRKHYETNQTEQAGREFALAHKKTKVVFSFLCTTYSTILMTYNVHSELVIPRRLTAALKAQMNKGGRDFQIGMKAPLPVVRKELAFTYESDELRFYEELYCISEEFAKLAFAGDEVVKRNAQVEIQRLFRSNSFRFQTQSRENDILSKTGTMERRSKGLLNNNRKMVELLQPTVPNLVLKYAIQQRSPFISSKFTGGTHHMQYQRVRKNGGGVSDEPSKLERVYRVETDRTPFMAQHPALVNIPKSQRPQSRSIIETPVTGSVSRKRAEVESTRGPVFSTNQSEITISDGSVPQMVSQKTTTEKKYLGQIPDFDDSKHIADDSSASAPPPDIVTSGVSFHSEEMGIDKAVVTALTVRKHDKQVTNVEKSSMKKLQGKARQVAGAAGVLNAVRKTASENEAKRRSPAFTQAPPKYVTNLTTALSGAEDEDLDFDIIPEESWLTYDPMPEIEAMYQAMRFGVDAATFKLPRDITLAYDEEGHLVPSAK